MNVIVPIVSSSAVDRSLLIPPESGAVASGLRLAVELTRLGCAVHVAAAEPGPLASLRALGVTTHVIPDLAAAGTEPGAEALPGLTRAVRHLLDVGALSAGDSAVAVDFRNIGLSARSVLAALDRARGFPEGVAASMEPTRDYPTQFFVACRVLAFETLVFPEPEAGWAGLSRRLGLPEVAAFSRPFPFDWEEGAMVARDDAPFALETTAPWGTCRRAVDAADVPALLERRRVILCREETGRARRLWPAVDAFRAVREAAPALLPNGCFPVNATRLDDGVAFSCSRNTAAEGLAGRAWCFDAKGLASCREFETRTPDVWRNARPGGDAPDGALVALLRTDGQGEADFFEPVDCEDGLWRVDPVTGERLDPETGRGIMQRQDAPDLYTLDGAVLAGRVELLARLNGEGLRFLPLSLPEEERFKVVTEFDALRANLREAYP